MPGKTPIKLRSHLLTLGIIAIISAISLHLFSSIFPEIQENKRMDRVARILEKSPQIIKTYGPNCKIRRLEHGLQMAAVMHGEYSHNSPFEIITPQGLKTIMVNWSGGPKGLAVTVTGFEEIQNR